jgi:hypothetical protein
MMVAMDHNGFALAGPLRSMAFMATLYHGGRVVPATTVNRMVERKRSREADRYRMGKGRERRAKRTILCSGRVADSLEYDDCFWIFGTRSSFHGPYEPTDHRFCLTV